MASTEIEEDYEALRQRRIAQNRAILASLQIEKLSPSTLRKQLSAVTTASTCITPSSSSKKRKFSADPSEGSRRKSARVIQRKDRDRSQQSVDQAEALSPSDSSRASSRLFSTPSSASSPDTATDSSDKETPQRRVIGGRNASTAAKKSLPAFGSILGVKVGAWYPSRQDVANANVHKPWVAGIHGNTELGCYSVALSGGYEDDIDNGDSFTYTGSGGRDLKKGNRRTAEQSRDQKLEGNNLALVKSYETRTPIRVVRGFKGKNRWSPKIGYRYDGLYTVSRWEKETGLSGFKVFRFFFERVPGQLPLQLEGEEEVSVEGQDDNEDQELEKEMAQSKEERKDPDKDEIEEWKKKEKDELEQLSEELTKKAELKAEVEAEEDP